MPDVVANVRAGNPLARLPSLSLVIPVHNESSVIAAVLRDAVSALAVVADRWEIVVVDDGSRDRTAEVVTDFAQTHHRGRNFGRIRRVGHDRNLGYGAALRTGFVEARGRWVAYIDGDGQFAASDLVEAVAALSGSDIVVGRRAHRDDAWIRRFNGWMWSRAVDLVFGLGVTDIDCGLKVFPDSLLREIDLRSDGAAIDAEIMIQARRRGYSVREINVRHLPRRTGHSSGGDLRVLARAAVEFAGLLRRFGPSEN